MGDRIRLGELLAGIGAIGLTVLLLVGSWFQFEGGVGQFEGGAGIPADGAPAYAAITAGSVGSRHLGWFILLLAGLAAASTLWYLVRALTAKSTERPMLMAPVAYFFALFGFIAMGLRLLLGNPEYTFDASDIDAPAGTVLVPDLAIPLDVAPGGWLGLFAIYVIVVGVWLSMSDERTDSAGARARTRALLAGVVTRPAAPVGGHPHPLSDAGAVADDAVGTDPDRPSSNRPSGGPA